MRMSLDVVHDIHYAPRILRIHIYLEEYLPLELVMSIGFLGKVESDVKERLADSGGSISRRQ